MPLPEQWVWVVQAIDQRVPDDSPGHVGCRLVGEIIPDLPGNSTSAVQWGAEVIRQFGDQTGPVKVAPWERLQAQALRPVDAVRA